MRAILTLLTISSLIFPLLTAGCQGEEGTADDSMQVMGEGIEIENAWARPGSEGRMSAGYFTIINYENDPDTLTGVSSGAAQLTEIHESYELEGGMMGMREVSELIIPAQSSVNFEPGGLHIMFIQLTEPLVAGEVLELTLAFSNSGEKTISAEIRP
jgi:periplasmic copper chaperone A